VEGGYLTSGPNTWPKHQANTTDRMLRPGDIMYADFYSATFQGYRSCVYRTFSIGKPRQRSVDAYKRARDWMYDVIEAIRPGVTTGEVARYFPDREGERMDWYGADHYWQMTTNQWAHGLGLQLYERPLIWRGISVDHPIEIQEGMTMAVETQEPDGPSSATTTSHPPPRPRPLPPRPHRLHRPPHRPRPHPPPLRRFLLLRLLCRRLGGIPDPASYFPVECSSQAHRSRQFDIMLCRLPGC